MEPLEAQANARLIAAAPDMFDALLSIATGSDLEGAADIAQSIISKIRGDS
jgi:hypothetical protein